MPILQNPRHEAFAQSRSRGALLDEAYEHAGFIPGHGHASRLAATPEIVERIAELNMARFQTEEVTSSVMISALLRVAQSSEALASAAASSRRAGPFWKRKGSPKRWPSAARMTGTCS